MRAAKTAKCAPEEALILASRVGWPRENFVATGKRTARSSLSLRAISKHSASMPIFPDRTLDQRLSAMVSLVSGLVLALAVAIFAGASITGARQDLENRLVAWSDAIASGSRSTLIADDGR